MVGPLWRHGRVRSGHDDAGGTTAIMRTAGRPCLGAAPFDKNIPWTNSPPAPCWAAACSPPASSRAWTCRTLSSYGRSKTPYAVSARPPNWCGMRRGCWGSSRPNVPRPPRSTSASAASLSLGAPPRLPCGKTPYAVSARPARCGTGTLGGTRIRRRAAVRRPGWAAPVKVRRWRPAGAGCMAGPRPDRKQPRGKRASRRRRHGAATRCTGRYWRERPRCSGAAGCWSPRWTAGCRWGRSRRLCARYWG